MRIAEPCSIRRAVFRKTRLARNTYNKLRFSSMKGRMLATLAVLLLVAFADGKT